MQKRCGNILDLHAATGQRCVTIAARENRERSRATLLSGFSQMSGSQARTRRRRGGVRRRAPDRSHVLVHQNRISVGIDSDETGRSGCGLVGLQLELHSLSLELPLQFAYVGE
jgi:hypothetical protein